MDYNVIVQNMVKKWNSIKLIMVRLSASEFFFHYILVYHEINTNCN